MANYGNTLTQAFMNLSNSKFFLKLNEANFEFNLSYLYIPMGGNKISRKRQIVAILLSFAFMSYWHGQSMDVQLWTFGNFLMVFTENLFISFVLHNPLGKRLV